MHGNLMNRLQENMVNRPAPEVGGKATISMYSDRHPCTIIGVTADLVIVQRDKVTGDTSKGELDIGHQNWIIERDAGGPVEVFFVQASGRIVDYGSRKSKSAKNTGCVLLVGTHNHYHCWEF